MNSALDDRERLVDCAVNINRCVLMFTLAGKPEQLLGKLQERYGYASDQAEKEVDRFMSKCGCSDSDEMSDRSERDTTMKVGRH